MNYVFYEELEYLPDSSKAAIYGMFTGSIYKCTRGWRAAMFSSVLGAATGFSFAYSWERKMKGRSFGL